MYKYHCENLRTINFAIKQMQRDLRQYIARGKSDVVEVYTRILTYLVVCWTEISLHKLLSQRGLFTQNEINDVMRKKTLETKWKCCLDIAICRNFRVQQNRIISNLPFTHRACYKELTRIIKEEMLPSIEARNRIAHGQWKYALTNDLSSISNEITGRIRNENILTLQLRIKILRTMVSIITDYCISPTLAMRDFDRKYKIIDQQVTNLHKRKYSDYTAQMRAKYQRGLMKRDEATIDGWTEEMRAY